jgi:phosphoglycolate phosphatase-like HAD superfamily hydrolase
MSCFFRCRDAGGQVAKFRNVVKRAGVDPRSAIAIGDEVSDLEATRAARIYFHAVTRGYTAEEALRAGPPEMVLDDMGDIVRGVVGGTQAAR